MYFHTSSVEIRNGEFRMRKVESREARRGCIDDRTMAYMKLCVVFIGLNGQLTSNNRLGAYGYENIRRHSSL